MIRCTCCQAEITCPQFVNGKPYGYTCVKKKIDPTLKRRKIEYKACESFKLYGDRTVTTRLEISYVLDGKRYNRPYYVDERTGVCNPSSGYIEDGVFFLCQLLNNPLRRV